VRRRILPHFPLIAHSHASPSDVVKIAFISR
jgi:hypothetical protein